MKKALLGCLFLFVLIAVAGGYAAYRFLYLPGKAYMDSFAQLKVLPELEAQIKNQTPFTPPADDLLTAESVERFVRTQRALRESLGAQMEELKVKYQKLGDSMKGEGSKASFQQAVGALKDLGSLVVAAKRVQVDALNAQGLSLAEYEWTRARVYDAAGLSIDASIQELIQTVATGGESGDAAEGVERVEARVVPPGNRALVQPYAQELSQTAPLVFFGL